MIESSFGSRAYLLKRYIAPVAGAAGLIAVLFGGGLSPVRENIHRSSSGGELSPTPIATPVIDRALAMSQPGLRTIQSVEERATKTVSATPTLDPLRYPTAAPISNGRK